MRVPLFGIHELPMSIVWFPDGETHFVHPSSTSQRAWSLCCRYKLMYQWSEDSGLVDKLVIEKGDLDAGFEESCTLSEGDDALETIDELTCRYCLNVLMDHWNPLAADPPSAMGLQENLRREQQLAGRPGSCRTRRRGLGLFKELCFLGEVDEGEGHGVHFHRVRNIYVPVFLDSTIAVGAGVNPNGSRAGNSIGAPFLLGTCGISLMGTETNLNQERGTRLGGFQLTTVEQQREHLKERASSQRYSLSPNDFMCQECEASDAGYSKEQTQESLGRFTLVE